MYFLVTSFDAVARTPDWLVIVSMVVPFSIGIGFYIYKTRHAKSWRKGVFPPDLKPTQDNFLEAYLALGAKLILVDYQGSKGKTQFINAYFNRYFKFANYNFGDSLVFSLRHPIAIYSVTDWLKKHLFTEGERTQIVYFLTGLAMVNGSLNRKELSLLQEINSELDLPSSTIPRIIAIFATYRNEQGKGRKKEEGSTYYYEILGVELNASNKEIKEAYRKLAKIHHPDVFASGTEVQKKLATEKFIQIQNAYNALMPK